MADNKPSEKLPTSAEPTALTCGKGTAEQHQVAVSGDVSSGDTNSQAGVPNLSLTRLVLLGACVHLANFSVGFSFNAIAITLDDAAKELEIIDRDLQWYFNSFFLALGCSLLVTGRAADIYGRKAVFSLGIILFGMFNLISGFMPARMGVFMCRAMTGVGAAMIYTSNAGLIVENTKPGRTRGFLVTFGYAGMSLGEAIGLVVSGPLTEAIKWRSAFWFLGGLTLLPIIIILLFVKTRAVTLRQLDRRVDWLGGILFTTGFVMLFFALSWGRSAKHGWKTDYIIVLLVLAPVAIGCAFAWERYLELRTNYPPVLRTSILPGGIPTYSSTSSKFCCMGASNAFQFITTIFYQRYQNLGPTQFALRLLPGPIVVSVGFVIKRVATYWFVFIGAIGIGLAHVLYAIKDQTATYWGYEFFGQMSSFAAPGLAATAGFVYITKVVKSSEVAVGNACLQFYIVFGGICGAALSTVVYTSVGDLDLNAEGDSETTKSALLEGLRAAHWFWAGLCFFGKPQRVRLNDYFFADES
ncbi:hypothetical protein QFC24_002110 [Naganishia onofrii]|uniref:Uncharacterized protein n=1 Tax=Naganishia onofrii TaxID=1851511 RepID=A0ACC2XR87_9TREE|nr:hypothetical protein QFC24_002110 [Naganishia onofrii]